MVMMRISLAVGMALCTMQTQALDNGLGKRPGLGWNSDYCTNCSVRGCRRFVGSRGPRGVWRPPRSANAPQAANAQASLG